MDRRALGSLSVSIVGLGCNNFARKIDQGESKAVVDAALDVGVNFFDTSDRYGYGDHPYSGEGRSEEFLAAALGRRRSDVVIATKFGMQIGSDPAHRGGKRSWVLQACEASLRRLRTDYIDLYIMHYPDPHTPIAETLGALHELIAAGKVREVGCSNFTAMQLTEAIEATEGGSERLARVACVENEYSLLRREAETDVLPICDRLDIAFLPYFPLASGLLTGQYSGTSEPPAGSRLAFWTPREHFRLDRETRARLTLLETFALERGRTLLELAVSWLAVQSRVVSVITGATSPKQIRENVAAAGWKLLPGDLRDLERVLA